MPCWRTTWLCKRAERKLDCHSNKLDDRAPTPLTATSTTTYSTNFCPRRFSGSARVDDNTAGVSGPYACTTSPSSSPLTATMSSRTSILPTAPSDYDGILPDFPSWSTSWSHTSSTSSPRNRPYSVNESSHPSRALIPHPHPGSCFGHQMLANGPRVRNRAFRDDHLVHSHRRDHLPRPRTPVSLASYILICPWMLQVASARDPP